MAFFIVITCFILQRLTELLISRRNERWLLQHVAIEHGHSHYPFILLLHMGFIGSVIAEYLLFPGKAISYSFLAIYVFLLLAKVWVICTLGHYWNTKIYRIPGNPPVHRGVYKYIKHPNYLIVIAEIIIFPLIFHLYYTAFVFTILNAVMLSVRIKAENKVWKQD
jgi:methyltransferase